MGKMKEVFALHQQEQEEFEMYYGEMYKIAKYMGTESLYSELYKSSIENKTSNKPKKEKNVRK
jgi:hypothetical protein|tara:strand:+ start:6 stop:194 length:189 start_codon:yes stop_codon:yes gene_type:complete